jgi:hypothetical protein
MRRGARLTGIHRHRKNRKEGFMRLPFHRSAAISLALCAMLLRALLPDGWMPAAAGSPSPFVICSVDGVHSGGKQPSDPAHEHTHAPCAFAAAAHLAPPVLAPVLAPAATLVHTVAFIRPDVRIDTHERHRPNAPRAPPVFS